MFPYENLEVYKKAFEFNKRIYSLLKTNKVMPGYVKEQLRRASLSIMLNIAEGSGKFSIKDRRNFFVIARGSAFECASIIEFLYSANDLVENDKKELVEILEEISRITYTMIKNLDEKANK